MKKIINLIVLGIFLSTNTAYPSNLRAPIGQIGSERKKEAAALVQGKNNIDSSSTEDYLKALPSFDRAYLKGLYDKFKTPESKPLVINDNFRPSALLNKADRERLLGAQEYSELVKNSANKEEAKNVVLLCNPMNGGLGTGVARIEYLKTIWDQVGRTGPIKIGAKGTDLYFDVTLKGLDEKVSISELKYLQALGTASNYKKVIIQELVNEDSEPFIKGFFGTSYIWDRVDKKKLQDKKRNYAQVIKKTPDIAIHENFISQAKLPTIDSETNAFTTKHTAPGGHGQLGTMALYDALAYNASDIEDLHERGVYIRAIYNGDGPNNFPDAHIVGWMAREKVPVVMLSTTKLEIDKKGGQLGVETLGNNKSKTQMLELDQAKDSGQEKLFYRVGLPGNTGDEGEAYTQYFNTNTALINYSVLGPFLNELRKIIGEEEFAKIITPDLIEKGKEKDGKKFIQLEGALGSALLNLNGLIQTTDNKEIKALLTEHKIKRILYVVNIDRYQRDNFFTPVKFSYDYWFYAYSDHFKVDNSTWKLKNLKPGHLPGFEEMDEYYLNAQNCIDALDRASTIGLNSLSIKGKVHLKNAILEGDVKIISQYPGIVDLNSKKARKRLNQPEQGKIKLDNTVIINEEGEVSYLLDYLTDTGVSSNIAEQITEKVLAGQLNFALFQEEVAIKKVLDIVTKGYQETTDNAKQIKAGIKKKFGTYDITKLRKMAAKEAKLRKYVENDPQAVGYASSIPEGIEDAILSLKEAMDPFPAIQSKVKAYFRLSAKLKELAKNSGLPFSIIPSQLPAGDSDYEFWANALRALHFEKAVYRRVEREGVDEERKTGELAFANTGVDTDILELRDYDVSKKELYSIRTGEQMRRVLMDPNAVVPLEAYFMHRGIFASIENIQEAFYKNKIRFDITVIPPANWGKEPAKTYGHYHDPVEKPEIYQVVSGEVMWLMQKTDENGKVLDFIAVRAKAGDIAIMLPGYGHVSVNISETEPLVMANWLTWNQTSYYGSFEEKRGAAYYVIRQENGQLALVPNPGYEKGRGFYQPKQTVAIDEMLEFGLKRGDPIYNLVNRKDFAKKVRFLYHPEEYENLLTVEATLKNAVKSSAKKTKGQDLLSLEILSSNMSVTNDATFHDARISQALQKISDLLREETGQDLIVLREAIRDAHITLSKFQKVKSEFIEILGRIENGKATALNLLEFMKKYTLLGVIHFGKQWPMAKNMPQGDGSWWKLQREEYRLPNKIDRGSHIEHMTSAGVSILEGDYARFERGLYEIITDTVSEYTTPDLDIERFEVFLKDVKKEQLDKEESMILSLGLLLHDYGRLIEGENVSMDLNTGMVVPSEGRLQHRESGVFIADELFRSLDYADKKVVQIVKFLIRHHSDFWDLYASDKYGEEFNNATTIDTLQKSLYILYRDLKGSGLLDSKISLSRFSADILKLLKVISIADVFASGDRYLSTNFIDYLERDAIPQLIEIKVQLNSSMNNSYWIKAAADFEKAKDKDPQPEWLFDMVLPTLPSLQSPIFEISCGSGRAMEKIIERGYVNIIGVDISTDALAIARQRGIPSDKLMEMNIISDAIPGKFDLIIANDILLYFREDDLVKVMTKIYTALENGGKLIIRWAVGNNEIVDKGDHWVFLATKDFLEKLMRDHGFEITHLRSKTEPIYVGSHEGEQPYCDYWYLVAEKIQPGKTRAPQKKLINKVNPAVPNTDL